MIICVWIPLPVQQLGNHLLAGGVGMIRPTLFVSLFVGTAVLDATHLVSENGYFLWFFFLGIYNYISSFSYIARRIPGVYVFCFILREIECYRRYSLLLLLLFCSEGDFWFIFPKYHFGYFIENEWEQHKSRIRRTRKRILQESA